MTEAQLAEKFFKYFEGCEIYKEVPTYYGRCDFFAISGPIYIAVEVKKQFSTQVIYQAMRNRRCSNYTYVAVPRPSDGEAGLKICKELGIGVLWYNPDIYPSHHDSYTGRVAAEGPNVKGVIERVLPAAYRRVIEKPRLLDEMKDAVAGSQYNTMSPFKVTVSVWEQTIKRAGGCIPLNEMFKEEKYHYSSPKHARQAVVRLTKEGVLKQFDINKGIISLKAA